MEGKSLAARGLCKTYGKVRALDHVSLTLEPGHIYGLIGRNGAGKTTLLAGLTAQLPLDEGQVAYGGAPVWENEAALADLCAPSNPRDATAQDIKAILRELA